MLAGFLALIIRVMTKTRNRLEQKVADNLGPEWEYEAIKLPYVIHHTYLPDFIDRENKIIKETKGRFDAGERRKMKAVKLAHPEWRIIMIFSNPEQKISKTSKTTYRSWCEANSIEVELAPPTPKKAKK